MGIPVFGKEYSGIPTSCFLFVVHFWKGEVSFQDVIKINPETSKVLKPEN